MIKFTQLVAFIFCTVLVTDIHAFNSTVFAQANMSDADTKHQKKTDSSQTNPPQLIKPGEEIASRAQAAAKAFQTRGMLELVQTMSARVRASLGVVGDEAKRNMNPNPGSGGSLRAILFASSSIPIETLRRYAAQLEKIGGVMVFRGAPGGLSKLTPMVKLTEQIIKDDPACSHSSCTVRNVGVLLDPLLFRNNQINKVPALMIMDANPFDAYCDRPSELAGLMVGSAISYGDAHLSGHLEALARLGDHRADTLLQQLLEPQEKN